MFCKLHGSGLPTTALLTALAPVPSVHRMEEVLSMYLVNELMNMS